MMVTGRTTYLHIMPFTGFVDVGENGNIFIGQNFNQIRFQIHINVALVDHLPERIGEIFDTENDRQRRVVDDFRILPFIHAPQIVFGDVAYLLRCSRALDWRGRKCEDNITFFEIFQCLHMAVHIFRRIDRGDVAMGYGQCLA